MNKLARIIHIAGRECRILVFKNPIYIFCMVVIPITVIFFMTSVLSAGQAVDLPVGVVDQDNTATSRQLIRTLDSFQTSHVVGHYANVNDARNAIQRREIYAFLYIPEGTTGGLSLSRQPKISFYYNSTYLLAGSSTFRDLKTVATLGSAGVGKQKLSAIGKTEHEIRAFLQPISVDLHMVGNPWSNYNIYLSSTLVPGLLMLMIFLISAYSIGTELKFGTSHEWMRYADGDPWVAIIGKMIPQTIVFLLIFYGFEFYIYYVLDFPHPGGVWPILLLGFLSVVASQSFGIFLFGLAPSLRMSMTLCCLLAMLGISMAGATFPVFAMDGALQSLSWIFPLRHYYMIYQINIFNGFPLLYAWPYWAMLVVFMILPLFVTRNIYRAMLVYKYIP